jgi:hypothetical protein
MNPARPRPARPIAAAIAALLTACGPVTNARDGGADAMAGADGAGAVMPVGNFKLQLNAPSGMTPGSTTVVGRVQDGPAPTAIQ